MSPTVKTLLMAVATALLALTAAAVYPWPETIVQSELVGKPLFDKFDPTMVRKIKIVRFDRDTARLDPIEVDFKGDTWVLPDFMNFPATNTGQYATAVNALLEREVLMEATDEQEKHREYGVVDPTLFNTIADRSALGTKVIFEGATGNVLASIIVGNQVNETNENAVSNAEVQHYVLIPGQPKVYVIELNRNAFRTGFKNWTNPNLFGISTEPKLTFNLEIENSRIAPEDFGKKSPERIYRAQANGSTAAGFQVKSFEIAGQNGNFQAAKLNQDLADLWVSISQNIRSIEFNDVRRKASELADRFSNPSAENGLDEFAPLKDFGFQFSEFRNGMPQFETSNGKASVSFPNGIRLKMLLGAIATDSTSEQNDLNRYAMIVGEFDEGLLEKAPSEPKPTGDATQDESNTKAYLRLVKERDRLAAEAKSFVQNFNRSHARWVYLVSESKCRKLVPDIDLANVSLLATPAKPATSTEDADAAKTDAADKSSDADDDAAADRAP